MLAVKLASPLYFAVIECDPADKLANESCAALLETVAVPKDVVPSRNVTVPVAPPPNAGCIVAERTTDCPNTAGFALDDTVVALEAELTLCARPVDVLPVR